MDKTEIVEMTEITTFKGNWAEFPGEPTFMGRRLLESEQQMFDRACSFAQRFRDLCRETGFDFNKKYLVEVNQGHNKEIDYDEIAWLLETAPYDEYPSYPDGGRVGDMVYFDCVIHTESRATCSYKARYANNEKTAIHITPSEGWRFDGMTLDFTMHCISIDGLHPCAPPYEWSVMCHSEPDRGYLDTLEGGFEELRRKYLDNDGYILRPMSYEEVEQFPNTDRDYCVSRVIPF